MNVTRRAPVGAETQPHGGVHFRVWAPAARDISVVVTHGSHGHTVRDLAREPHGYASVWVPEAGVGDTYVFRLNGKELPDPASRFQPEGPIGPSQIVDRGTYEWADTTWQGPPARNRVVYEMHCGTFTPEGTWRAAIPRLLHLAQLGINVVELMPVAEFPGNFGWGYDGVFPYAPTRLYGRPDDFRAFVDAAHASGVAVILDVVYNHLGPDGCVFRDYAPEYFTDRYTTEWGEPLNFDGAHSGPVREYFVSNAAYWVREFHLDGLRLDATQCMYDASSEHVVASIARAVREAGGHRRTLLIAENEPQDTRLVQPADRGGYGLDALWNDDFHHSAVVALTGRREAYYSDHRGVPQEFVSAAKYGYLFQGQRYHWQKKSRGTPSRGIPRSAFVNFIENHDQVANSADGCRLHARCAPAAWRAMTALLLLMPGTPMLFQGQEFASSRPFLYFADQHGELARAVERGRAEFLAQFPSIASAAVQQQLALPHDPLTFARCKLDWHECEAHVGALALHRDLLGLRRSLAVFTDDATEVDGAVIAADAFVLRFFAPAAADERLLVVNFGGDVVTGSLAEPLVAPPASHMWQLTWASELTKYGGAGVPDIVSSDGWHIPAQCTVLLGAVPDPKRS